MTDWMIRLIDWGGYGGVFALMLLETMVPVHPVRGDPAARRAAAPRTGR